MREIADLLLVFLLNLIASTGGTEPPPKPLAPAEEAAEVASGQAALAPICESAPVLISAPIPRDGDLLLIARLRDEKVKDLHAPGSKKVHKRTRLIPRLQDPL